MFFTFVICHGRNRMPGGYICNQCLSPLLLWVRIALMDEACSIQYYVMQFVDHFPHQ